MIKDIPFFFGYGTHDKHVTEYNATRSATMLRKYVTRNLQFRAYQCLGHKCSNEVGIFIPLSGFFFIGKFFTFPSNIPQIFCKIFKVYFKYSLNSLPHFTDFYCVYAKSIIGSHTCSLIKYYIL